MSQPLAALRVLLVDDSKDVRNLYAVILRRAGASVVAVASAEEALALLAAGGPDGPTIVVTDIGLPNMDGLAFVRAIRATIDRAPDRLPAIALTGLTEPQDVAAIRAAGFDAYLAKPVEREALLGAVSLVAGR